MVENDKEFYMRDIDIEMSIFAILMDVIIFIKTTTFVVQEYSVALLLVYLFIIFPIIALTITYNITDIIRKIKNKKEIKKVGDKEQ